MNPAAELMMVTTPREYALVCALQLIVMETMDHPIRKAYSSDSHLPKHVVDIAQQALSAYGMRIEPLA